MIKRINFKIYVCLFVCLFVSTNLFSQEYKWIQIGALHGWFSDFGNERELGAGSSNQQRGLRWPAFFKEQDCQAAKALWIGLTNFTDATGRTWDTKVLAGGPRKNGVTEFFPQKFIMETKFDPPTIIVDGLTSTYIEPEIDETDPDLPADRVITNVVNTLVGIEMTRKIYAFSHSQHDNYFIYEYEFKNTGDINGDGIPELNKTLEGVYFYFQQRYSPGREGSIISPPAPNETQWGMGTLFESVGDELNSGSPYRAIFARQGKSSKSTVDLTGLPNTFKPDRPSTTMPYAQADGHLQGAQYVGWCTIHADKSATDKSDDRLQPSTVSYEDSDNDLVRNDDADHLTPDKNSKRYEWITRGWKRPRHNELVGDGNVDAFAPSGGGFSAAEGYGPYTIPIGASVKIVVCEAVAGLSRDMCYSVGADWYITKNCTFPGVTGNDNAKNAWVYTGRDSLLQTFQKAIDNWNSGLKLPQPPEPPSIFEINSGGDKISLSWANNSERDPNFKCYRLYRADSSWDKRKYELIAELPKGVTTYNDMTPVRGYNYFYYLQCVGNDGLISNRQHTQTYEAAYLMREAVDDQDNMKDIRVVPNPYNTRARSLQYKEVDKIMFLDIPAECTIKIYTERGDLIKTIHHTNGAGDESWTCTTDYRQVVVSGLYIAHFETPDGRSTFRKFVVIR